ncbi:MAG: Rpn family recombination-promoting nuclease/putative transposase, partial [Oligoflexia bacterium]|nr:Rpn family recombination-promoting nuclease/putative transposase [Oligoflexia bacterium]
MMTKQAQKLKKSKKPTCSHDSFFKLIFFDPELMKELLKLVLTKAEEKVFNLDKIKFEKDSHKKQLADIVLSFPLKSYPKQSAEFFMILEHKSHNDKQTYDQMLKYLYLFRELILKQTGRAKPIIPALFFHGKQAIKLKNSLLEEDFKNVFSKIPIETRKSMLNFELK